MKANELMLGDWVYSSFSDIPCEVQYLELRESGYGSVKTSNVDGIKDIVSLYPIPLTPEILEKNGFVNYEEDEENFHNEDCVFIKQNLGGYGACLDKIRTISGIFHYVHELQHALRLCGIEKTIEL